MMFLALSRRLQAVKCPLSESAVVGEPMPAFCLMI